MQMSLTLRSFSRASAALLFCLVPFATASKSGAVLKSALDSVQADKISADLHFIASDELRGRDTPSPELRVAARFIAARLERLGWKPGAKDGWFQEFEASGTALDGEQSRVNASSGGETVELVLGEDYAFYPNLLNTQTVSAERIVHGGTLSAADLEGLELKGHWVLCTHSDLDDRAASRNARRARAAGVLVLPGPGLDEDAMRERVAAWAKAAVTGRLSRGYHPHSAARLYLTRSGEQKLLALAGVEQLSRGDVLDIALTERRVAREDLKLPLENVVGFWPGSDPQLRREALILCAHYDHVGQSSSGEVFNGADDNGSGTVGLLAVAEALTRYGPMRRSVVLIWVAGEEKGLLGSEAWADAPWLPEGAKAVACINVDMIGRNAPEYLLITPTRNHRAYNGLTRRAEANAKLEGFPKLGSCDDYWSRSDHTSFSKQLKIPVAFLFNDIHEDYHRGTDTADKIDYDKIRRVVRLLVRVLDGLQGDELAL